MTSGPPEPASHLRHGPEARDTDRSRFGHVDDLIADRLNIWSRSPDLTPWQRIVDRFKKPAKGSVTIGVVGKYVQLEDAYKSLREACLHGGLAHDHKTVLEWIEAEEIDSVQTAAAKLRGFDGILVPGGFGKRGVQGMIYTIQYAREQVSPELWLSPIFIRINQYITAVWGFDFFLSALVSLYRHETGATGLASQYAWVLFSVGAALFTVYFPDWYRDRAVRPAGSRGSSGL